MTTATQLQRPSAENIYADELSHLKQWDSHHCPPGWQMSPLAVEKFILGDRKLSIEKKIVAPREVIGRIIIGLATNRGAMLVGEPGTAKSWLSELLCAAISNQSTLTIQGGAIEQVTQLLYSWNEALLQTDGPSLAALRPGPIYQGMKQGKLVRFEEIARCTPALQDAILSILSERMILVPELSGEDSILYAREGFNIVATSNSLDEGVNVMSAALKRRLNFETVRPIAKVEDEIGVIYRESKKMLVQSGVPLEPDIRIIEVLATIFHELRNGCSLSGRSTDRLASTVMSTAEAVAVAHAMGVYAYYYRDSEMQAADMVHFLVGAALKDNETDRRRMKHYFETEVANKKGPIWKEVLNSIDLL